MDVMSLKEIQNKLLLWEASENPLAPLSPDQKEAILDLESLIHASSDEDDNVPESTSEAEKSSNAIPPVDSTCEFLEWYESLCEADHKLDDEPYEAYYKQLEDRKNECNALTDQIKATMMDLNKLSEEYLLVSNKTNALHNMSEQLLADQNKLSAIGEDIKHRLHYFTQVEHLSQRLNSPTMSVNSEAFFNVLAKIDECLDYMRQNTNYKESHTYQVKYRHLQSRAISLIRSYVTHVLNHATQQVLAPKGEDPTEQETMETAYAVYFGKFQAAAPKLKMVISEVETRAERNQDYASLLSDIQREYATCRSRVAGAPTAGALSAAAARHTRDHCTLLRTACSLLAHACRDECALYYHFFSDASPALQDYLQSLCNGLYETMRPHVIHINHLETLAELCVILRVEVIEEQVNNDPVVLGALGRSAGALLQDAQERLVFRAHVHLRADVLHYRPAPGDLAYPDKLEMMEQIAASIAEGSLRRSDSRVSATSLASAASQEVAAINAESQRRPAASPADLHGMWYPAVRRTLAALSRLYRCLEKKVFQGLAQEAISLCVQSVDYAAKQISATKTKIDGELFQIKHLLILREQIAPFQVDFIVKETTLDFSNVKNAAYGLIHRPRQIFSLNSNNALLEFLLEGTPMVREHLLDSRKEVDRQLKSSCETFIKDATEILAGPVIEFVEKTQAFSAIDQLKEQPWATPEAMAEAVKEAQKRIRANLAPLQRSMQLYLANKETEFILFRPIRNNVVGYFIQIEQLLTNAGYSYEDSLLVACPTPEQMSVFLSSASLISHSEPVLPYGKKRKTSSTIKPTVTKGDEKLSLPNVSSTEEKSSAPSVSSTTEKFSTPNILPAHVASPSVPSVEGQFSTPLVASMEGKFGPPNVPSMEGKSAFIVPSKEAKSAFTMPSKEGKFGPPNVSSMEEKFVAPNVSSMEGTFIAPNVTSMEGNFVASTVPSMEGKYTAPNMPSMEAKYSATNVPSTETKFIAPNMPSMEGSAPNVPSMEGKFSAPKMSTTEEKFSGPYTAMQRKPSVSYEDEKSIGVHHHKERKPSIPILQHKQEQEKSEDIYGSVNV